PWRSPTGWQSSPVSIRSGCVSGCWLAASRRPECSTARTRRRGSCPTPGAHEPLRLRRLVGGLAGGPVSGPDGGPGGGAAGGADGGLVRGLVRGLVASLALVLGPLRPDQRGRTRDAADPGVASPPHMVPGQPRFVDPLDARGRYLLLIAVRTQALAVVEAG